MVGITVPAEPGAAALARPGGTRLVKTKRDDAERGNAARSRGGADLVLGRHLVVLAVFLAVVLRVVIRVALEVDAVEHGADDVRARVLELLDRRTGGVAAHHLGADYEHDTADRV